MDGPDTVEFTGTFKLPTISLYNSYFPIGQRKVPAYSGIFSARQAS
jgi:hypothetical protein